MRIARLLLAVLVLATTGVSLRPQTAEAAYRSAAVEYGAALFPLGSPDPNADFQVLANAGLTWARVTIPWRSIEASCHSCSDWTDLDRVVAAAMASGIKIVARVDRAPAWASSAPWEDNAPPTNPDDYAHFVAAMVERYGAAGIPVIEVWNEPNLSREWGGQLITRQSATQYAYMLKLAYRSAHEFDPNITVISSGLSPTATADGSAQPDDVYLTWLYEEGMAGFTDGVGLIANSFGLPPAAGVMSDPGSRPYPFMYFRHVEQMRDIMVAYGDAGKQAWLMEFGYTSDSRPGSPYAWHAVDEGTKATYITEGLQYARANYSGWAAMMSVWAIADRAWTPDNEQYWWAITEPDGAPRPAYQAIAAMPK